MLIGGGGSFVHLRRWLAMLLVAGLVLTLAAPALAAGTTELDRAVETLKQYGIVQGDPSGDMRLNDPITRAEFMKVLIAAAGESRQAQLLQGAAAFTDTANHWASGYIAVAKQLGITGGYPDGSFKPDAQITNAEVIALLVRLVKAPVTSTEWPTGWIQAAAAAGITPAGLDLNLVANVPATRGAAFLLSHNAFSKVKSFKNGLSLYQAVFDSAPPQLTLDAVEEATTASTLTISGKVKEAEILTVNGQSVGLTLDGSFATTVSLSMGENLITVEAIDQLGNVARKELKVQRTSGVPARIEAPARVTLKVGESKQLDVTVKDAGGFMIPNPAITGESDVVSFDPTTGTIRAVGQTGTGTLTLRAGEATATVTVTVASGEPAKLEISVDKTSVAVGEQAVVQVTAYDAGGNTVTGYEPTFSVSDPWALINAKTGVFAATRPGKYTVTVWMEGLTKTIDIGVYDDEPADLRLSGPKTIVGNGKPAGPFTVSVVDQNGSVIGDATRTVNLDFQDAKVVDEQGREMTSAQLVNGQGTFYLQADAAHWGVVMDLTAEDSEDLDLEDTLEIEVMEQIASGIKTVYSDKYLAANDGAGKATLRFAVVDQAGVEVLDGSWDLDFEISGPALEDSSQSKTGTIYYYGDTPAELVLDAITGQTGTIRIEVSASGLATLTETVQAVIARSASRVQVSFNESSAEVNTLAGPDDGGIEVMVTVTDDNGVPVEHDGEVYVDFSQGFTDIYGDGYTEDRDGDGEYDRVVLTFDGERRQTFWVSSEIAGTYQVTVDPADSGLAAASGEITFTAGRAATVGFERTRMLLPVTNPEGSVTLRLYDEFGNPAQQGGIEIEIEGQDGFTETSNIRIDGRAGSKTVTTKADGTVTVPYWARPDMNANYRLVIASVSGGLSPNVDRDEMEFDVVATVPASIKVEFASGSAITSSRVVSAYAGDPDLVLKVTLLDQYGGGLSGYEDFLEVEVQDKQWARSTSGSGESAATIESYIADNWAPADDGIYYVYLVPAKAERATITVSVAATGNALTGTGVLRVRPGDPEQLILQEANFSDTPPSIELKEGQIKSFTLRLADRYGNITTGDQTYDAWIDTGSVDLVVRTTATGADLGGGTIAVRSGATVYLLLTNAADDGIITLRATGLSPSDVEVKGIE